MVPPAVEAAEDGLVESPPRSPLVSACPFTATTSPLGAWRPARSPFVRLPLWRCPPAAVVVYVLAVLEYVTCWSFTTMVTDLLFSCVARLPSPPRLEADFRGVVLVFRFCCDGDGAATSSRSTARGGRGEVKSLTGMVVVVEVVEVEEVVPVPGPRGG